MIIYDGEDWKLRQRDEILKELIDDKTDILSCKFDELQEKINEPTKRKFQRYLDCSDNLETTTKVKDDLQLTLYNNRKLTETTRGLLESE